MKNFAIFLIFCALYFLLPNTNLAYFHQLKFEILRPQINFPGHSLCHILRDTKMEGESIAVVRLLGPSLPPLQSPQQMSSNLKFLLLREKTLRSSQQCVKSLWVVGCNYNFTERAEIISTLRKHNQNYSGICCLFLSEKI